MIYYNETQCPMCGGDLKPYGYRKRIVRSQYGKKEFIKIKRMICSKCKRTHRVLPKNLMPYKHYENDIVKGFINGTLSQEDLEYEDYPSESIINEWKRTH